MEYNLFHDFDRTAEYSPEDSVFFGEILILVDRFFSIYREILGNFYVLSSQKFLDFTKFWIFFYCLESNFAVENDVIQDIQAENH